MRPMFVCVLLVVFVAAPYAQEPILADVVLYETTFEDWDTSAWWTSSPLTIVGVFVDIPGNETEAMEVVTTGGTTNIWDEQMGTNWATPENSTTLAWRIQFRVRVDHAPYNIPTYLQINQDPWSGVSTTVTIPAGFEKKWLSYDFILGPSNVFTTADMGLRFQLGSQAPQTLQFDDIRVALTQALTSRSYEGTTDIRAVFPRGGTAEAVTMDGAPNGTTVAKFTVNQPGSTIEDAAVILGRFTKVRTYDGALRLNLTVRSSVAPLVIRGGYTNSSEWTGATLPAVQEVTLTEKGVWTDISFLLPPYPETWSVIFPYLQLGGQGNVVLEFDNLYLYRTNETTPVWVTDWSLF
ncbi:MAG TPA: hypothetical protein PK878_03610 [bacterium]|nr:hypothetical protein [bacterium]HOL95186.1 hypothetical protein [bacterium]HPP01893.1 hypothetical protein [bacterium]